MDPHDGAHAVPHWVPTLAVEISPRPRHALSPSELYEHYRECVDVQKTDRTDRNHLSKLAHYNLIEEVPETYPQRYRITNSPVAEELFGFNSAINAKSSQCSLSDWRFREYRETGFRLQKLD